MRSPLKTAQLLLLQGQPLPVTLTTTLLMMGVDVSAMERRFAQTPALVEQIAHGT